MFVRIIFRLNDDVFIIGNYGFFASFGGPCSEVLVDFDICSGGTLLLNKLRIPHLLGLIIAGAIIGPNGFNLVLRDSSIILSGTAGLLYIMFLAGLEIDLEDFKKNSGKSLIFGMYTFLIRMVFGNRCRSLRVEFFLADFHFIGQYVCFAYVNSLSYYQ